MLFRLPEFLLPLARQYDDVRFGSEWVGTEKDEWAAASRDWRVSGQSSADSRGALFRAVVWVETSSVFGKGFVCEGEKLDIE